MPRLVVATPYARPADRWGGPVPVVHDWSAALSRRGWEVLVVSTNADIDGHTAVPLDRHTVVGGVPHLFCWAQIGYPFFLARGLRSSLAREIVRADLVHSHGMWTFPGLASASTARARGVPYVVTPHGSLDPWSLRRRSLAKRALLLLERRRLRGAAAVHFTSAREAGSGRELCSPAPVIVAPCIVPDRSARPDRDIRSWLGLGADARTLLFLGRLHPKKGLDVLLKAFGLLADDPRIHLLVAGPGEPAYQRELLLSAIDSPGANRIRFVGMARDGLKAALLEQCDVFCLASHQENFGMAIAEAMQAGCPVVVSHQVDISEEIVETGAGVAAPLDAGSFARAIRDVLDDDERRRAMGRAASRLVRTRYSEAAVGDALDAAFREIVARASHASG